MIIIKKVPYKSIEVETNTGKIQTISENDEIRFVTEDNGEIKKGIVTGYKGTKEEKVEIEFIPSGGKHRETWSIVEMVEGSLRLVSDEDEEEEDYNEEE